MKGTSRGKGKGSDYRRMFQTFPGFGEREEQPLGSVSSLRCVLWRKQHQRAQHQPGQPWGAGCVLAHPSLLCRGWGSQSTQCRESNSQSPTETQPVALCFPSQAPLNMDVTTAGKPHLKPHLIPESPGNEPPPAPEMGSGEQPLLLGCCARTAWGCLHRPHRFSLDTAAAPGSSPVHSGSPVCWGPPAAALKARAPPPAAPLTL